MAEPPKPPYGYKAIPMNCDRSRMIGRGAALYIPWAIVLYGSYGSARTIPGWLWCAPFLYLFIWEFADMVWWNFQRLHERMDELEARLLDESQQRLPIA